MVKASREGKKGDIEMYSPIVDGYISYFWRDFSKPQKWHDDIVFRGRKDTSSQKQSEPENQAKSFASMHKQAQS